MWPLEVLDVWDSASAVERKAILAAWPRWRDALAEIERERAVVVSIAPSAPKQRRKRKPQQRTRAPAAAEARA
jgi:hypothetical protein